MAKKIDTAPDHPSDREIIELYFSRNEKALRVTAEKYGAMIRKTALKILENNEDAEECENDTYIKLWGSIPPKYPNVLPAYITVIAKNIAGDKLKEHLRQKRVPKELVVPLDSVEYEMSGDDSPDSELAAAECARFISEFLRTLPKKWRYAFTAKYYMDMPIDEIAEKIKVTPSGVYKELKRIKRELKEFLTEKGVSV